jgi:protein-disulfide isomerase
VAKVRRKVVKRSSQQSLSVGMIALIIGGAIIVVVVILALAGVFRPKTVVAGDPQGLAMCGNIPCPTKGNSTAPVTMIDVSSYTCSHCQYYYLNTEPKIEEQYIKTGQVLYIAHPIGFEALAQGVTAAALCASEQDKFWEYSALLYQNQGQFDSASLARYAQQAGLDGQAFASCVNSGKHKGNATASTKAATDAGVNGTPTFFINGKPVEGALPFQCKLGTAECAQGDFQTRIEAALKGTK